MSLHDQSAIGFSVLLPSSQTSNEIRWAAWSMRRPVMRMVLLHSAKARWNGSTLLTKSKSAVSISSQSPYFALNSSRVVTPSTVFHSAFFWYFASTCSAHGRVVSKRCIVSIATRFMPLNILGKCSCISATKTLSVASQAVAKTTRLPSAGKCFSMSALKEATLLSRAAVDRSLQAPGSLALVCRWRAGRATRTTNICGRRALGVGSGAERRIVEGGTSAAG
mmetsp:Transcript_70482/g.190588  ORF Transcript_70482/g.190588 Transcript_70482/m.190588 type:complete len:222 (-) Transcript_70482:16-681(-)